MVGAVGQLHRHVDPREAERPMLEAVDHALLDRRNVVARHHAAGDLLLEREAGAARERLDVDHNVAELAMTARLLLVPATLGDRFADRLAVADARGATLDRHAEAIGEPLGRDPPMHLPPSP